jgi:hypothetical protein
MCPLCDEAGVAFVFLAVLWIFNRAPLASAMSAIPCIKNSALTRVLRGFVAIIRDEILLRLFYCHIRMFCRYGQIDLMHWAAKKRVYRLAML